MATVGKCLWRSYQQTFWPFAERVEKLHHIGKYLNWFKVWEMKKWRAHNANWSLASFFGEAASSWKVRMQNEGTQWDNGKAVSVTKGYRAVTAPPTCFSPSAYDSVPGNTLWILLKL